MSQLPKKEDLLKIAKALPVNLEVARTGKFSGKIDKPQTRRVVSGGFLDDEEYQLVKECFDNDDYEMAKFVHGFESPLKIGTIAWVREPVEVYLNHYDNNGQYNNSDIVYKIGNYVTKFIIPEKHRQKKWVVNCQGVPNGCIREMARYFYKVINVRVERLHDISKEDAIKEGIQKDIFGLNLWQNYMNHEKGFTPNKKYEFLDKKFDGEVMSFLTLFAATYGEEVMQSNPFVFVYEFEKVEYAN